MEFNDEIQQLDWNLNEDYLFYKNTTDDISFNPNYFQSELAKDVSECCEKIKPNLIEDLSSCTDFFVTFDNHVENDILLLDISNLSGDEKKSTFSPSNDLQPKCSTENLRKVGRPKNDWKKIEYEIENAKNNGLKSSDEISQMSKKLSAIKYRIKKNQLGSKSAMKLEKLERRNARLMEIYQRNKRIIKENFRLLMENS